MRFNTSMALVAAALLPAVSVADPKLPKETWTIFVFEDGCPPGKSPHDFYGGEPEQGAIDGTDIEGACGFPVPDTTDNQAGKFKAYFTFGLEEANKRLVLYSDDNCYYQVYNSTEDAQCHILPEAVTLQGFTLEPN